MRTIRFRTGSIHKLVKEDDGTIFIGEIGKHVAESDSRAQISTSTGRETKILLRVILNENVSYCTSRERRVHTAKSSAREVK